MLKFKEEKYFTMTGHELEEIIEKHLAPLTDNPKRFEKFECVCEFEWNNYARYDTKVEKTDIQSGIYQKFDRPDIVKADDREMFGLHGLLVFLLEHDIIPEGNYLIDPSW